MKVIIDRFEGEYAVCEKENGEMEDIKRNRIPSGAKEGDVLIVGDIIVIDKEETIKRRKEIEKLMKEIWG